MKHLSNLEYRQILECIGALYEEEDLPRLKQRLPAIVARLVPGDLIILDEFDLRRRGAVVVHATHPEKADFHFEPELARLIYEDHPCIQHIARTGCVEPLKITDFMSQRQYRQTRLYREGMRQSGAEYNIGFQVLEPCLPEVTNISLIRDQSDFSETDRLKLNLLRAHIGRAYIHAGQMAVWRAQAMAASDALAATRQAVIVATAGGAVVLCTDAARKHLACYFKDKPRPGQALPAKLRHWMRTQELPASGSGRVPRPRQPFVTERDGARLTVHFLNGATAGQRLLVLEECRLKLSAEPLQKLLGLTPRRAEVLLWVTQGKTSGEIAIILGVSVSTVHKHTECIFEKLGVETRTAAALRAHEVLYRVQRQDSIANLDGMASRPRRIMKCANDAEGISNPGMFV